jgi:hypothetical protein
MLRYAVLNAPKGATITFDPALAGQTIQLDGSSWNNHIKIGQDLTIQGPGANALTISGGNATRIFFISGGSVQISGLTLANGLGRGGDGAAGGGSAGGGGGAAGMGGAIFLQRASLTLSGTVFSHNRALGGNGGAGGSNHATGHGGSGGGFGGDGAAGPGGAGRGGDLAGGETSDGIGGAGGSGDRTTTPAGDGGFGAGGGGAGFHADGSGDAVGFNGGGGFGGGAGGNGGFYEAGEASVPGSGGGGGSGFGGAIFVSSGLVQFIDTTFLGNASLAGRGGFGGAAGIAKGGALFICSVHFCGPGHQAGAVWAGNSSASGSVAADMGGDCLGRDDADVCGQLTDSVPTHFSILGPPSVASGEIFHMTVVALDRNNTPVFTYAGSVKIASSDTNAALSPQAVLSGGVGTFTVALNTGGNQTFTVTDAARPSIAGTSNMIAVDLGKSVR